MAILRLEEEKTVHVVARAQNGTVVEDVMFDWEEGDDRDTVNLDPSDDTRSADVEAAEEGETTLTVTAVGHAVAADINITVTKAAKKITLMEGEEEFEVADSYAPKATIMLVASADVAMRAGSDFGWSSDDSSVKVEVNKGTNPHKAMATVTAVSRGDATITVSYEGVEKSFNVNVIGKETGAENDRTLTRQGPASTEFKWVRTGDDASTAWSATSIVFQVVLRAGDGTRLSGQTITATLTSPDSPDHAPASVAVTGGGSDGTAASTDSNGIATITVEDPVDISDASSDALDGTVSHTVEVSAIGVLEPVELTITTVVVE